MQFSHIALFGLLAIASAGPVMRLKRSAASIESKIATVNTQLGKVDTDIKNYNGGLLGPFELLILKGDLDTLDTDAQALANDVTSTGDLNAADSSVIATDISGLVDTLCQTLTDLESKAALIASGGYTSDVHNGLESVEASVDAFFVSLEATIDASQLSSILNSQADADDCFDAALAAI